MRLARGRHSSRRSRRAVVLVDGRRRAVAAGPRHRAREGQVTVAACRTDSRPRVVSVHDSADAKSHGAIGGAQIFVDGGNEAASTSSSRRGRSQRRLDARELPRGSDLRRPSSSRSRTCVNTTRRTTVNGKKITFGLDRDRDAVGQRDRAGDHDVAEEHGARRCHRRCAARDSSR